MADRLQDIVPRHAAGNPSLSMFGIVLELAEDFRARHTETLHFSTEVTAAFADVRAKSRDLYAMVKLGADLLETRGDSREAAHFGARPDAPGDLIHEAERLQTLLAPLQFAARDTLVTELAARADAVETALRTARAMRVELQARQAQTRAAAGELWTELVVYRKALRRALGSSHHDYQMLRTRRSRGSEPIEAADSVLTATAEAANDTAEPEADAGDDGDASDMHDEAPGDSLVA